MTKFANPSSGDFPGEATSSLPTTHLDTVVPGDPRSVMTTLHDPAPGRPVRLSVIVPYRHTDDNIQVFLQRLGPVVAPLSAEIIVVDEFDADIPAIQAPDVGSAPVAVRLLHRISDRRGGSNCAVIAGARHARGEWVLVVHADLQHPPESAAMLARTAKRHDLDIVVGVPYAGTEPGRATRTPGSSWATRLAKALFPRRLSTVKDPLSGFFAFRRSVVDLDRMHQTGSSPLLELLVRHHSARVAEVAYEIQPPLCRPKRSFVETLALLRHLALLRRPRFAARMRGRLAMLRTGLGEPGRMIAYGLVGLTGVGVNTAALWSLHDVLGMHYLLGAALATQVSTAWNFMLLDVLVYRHHHPGSRSGRALRYFLLNNVLLLLRLPMLQALVWASVDVLVANAVTLGALFLVRFLVSDRLIYRAKSADRRPPVRMLVDLHSAETAPAPSTKRYQYLEYRYDIAGVVTIGSQVMLPELEFFRAQWVGDREVDIAVRVGDVGGRGLKRRAAMTEYTSHSVLRYEEHLGRRGANFRVEFGKPINIEVGPLLARSPHVVYTNIIEAVLRFAMVSRGHMLLHSACVSLNGVGVMLSALTDTGKTATVLRLLRDHGGLFLSDDMTVVDAAGTAICFPKPLTISSHTLRAVQATDLTAADWRRLQFQSRLHSKGGRSFALRLSRFNVPIMGINAITQALIPPPKYSVDRLVSCRIGTATRVEELFIIEQGTPQITELDQAATLERMIHNTDDAYGFPPFSYLAPAITIDGQGYAQLRQQEREILASFLSKVRTRVVASDCFGWADEIPGLLRGRPTGSGNTDETGLSAELQAWPHWDSRLTAPATPKVIA